MGEFGVLVVEFVDLVGDVFFVGIMVLGDCYGN